MKIKLIAVVLLLTMLLGAIGCTAVVPTAEELGAANETPNFISGEKAALLDAEGEADTSAEDRVNIAATDEKGDAIFQIVYDIGAGLRVQEQCEALAADIYDETGVKVPVVHSSQKQQTYEVTVGAIKRPETIDKIDSFKLEDGDFVICVVETRVLIYAETDPALVSGVIFFTEEVAKKSTLEKEYSLAKDYDFTYHPVDNPSVTIEESDDRYINFKLIKYQIYLSHGNIVILAVELIFLKAYYRHRCSFFDLIAKRKYFS